MMSKELIGELILYVAIFLAGLVSGFAIFA